MKETIFDHIARGLVLGGLMLFGLRGVLPDLAETGDLPAMLVTSVLLIAAGAAGSYAYRCAYRCETTCALATCRAR